MNIRTLKLLEMLEHLINDKFDFPITYDFREWNEFFERNLNKINNELFEDGEVIEVKNDARRLVMNNIFRNSLDTGGHKIWDRNYVREKYQKNIDGCDLVYYPSKNPRRLVINFSSMGDDRFDRYSRYWDESELWEADSAYLFFKDDNKTYYLGTEKSPKVATYQRLIKEFYSMNGLNADQVFTVGSSMGAYAAIYYSVTLELKGCLVYAPQATFCSAQVHKYRNWEKHIKETGGLWVDLDILIQRVNKIPNFYIEVSNYLADKLAIDSLLDGIAQHRESLIIKRLIDSLEHNNDTVFI